MIVRERKTAVRLPAVMKGGPKKNPLGCGARFIFSQGNKDTLYRIHGHQ